MYEDKQPWYFNFVRRDIEALLPSRAERVLEIGCAAGATLNWLKESGRADHTTGIEPMAQAASVARARVDQVLEGPAEALLTQLPPESFDLVLCLDVLEHLVDPWVVMQQLRGLVRPGGTVIVSLPNVRNHRVVLPLLLAGRFEYQEAGIMDRTHLRFFSRQGALELLEHAGFRVTAEASTGLRRGDRDFWRNLFTGGLLAPLFISQHLLRGTRSAA
ncbi:class I SAM-dependent methyltransferase [Roseateles albus]|uniref:Class I SAM-dependent methyltransferase n=1 Tax=Roseateles albus TaxID=2987525 RepID=A0ABT5KGD4_9BURK|nr:class I SAM-dependent methyltransferase [Roseateles albus]MDC8772992.1 class I SAM-dependent methyltransferase [Roseateles albus]